MGCAGSSQAYGGGQPYPRHGQPQQPHCNPQQHMMKMVAPQQQRNGYQNQPPPQQQNVSIKYCW